MFFTTYIESPIHGFIYTYIIIYTARFGGPLLKIEWLLDKTKLLYSNMAEVEEQNCGCFLSEITYNTIYIYTNRLNSGFKDGDIKTYA